VDITQGVDKEGGREAFFRGLFSLLSHALAMLNGYECLEIFFFNWQGYSVRFGLGYFAHHIENKVAHFVV